MKIFGKHIIVFIVIILCCSSQDLIGQNGETLFKQNCLACHQLGKKFIGPDLLGISEKRDANWTVNFIKSSQKMIQAGDADAVAVYNEYNKVIMPDQLLSDGEINSIIAYIDSETLARAGNLATGNEEEEVEIIPIEYTEEDIENGKLLFFGKKRLANKGAACISCHHADNDEMISGGVLAKDLTNAYSRLGDAGMAGIIEASPFPVMSEAYKNNALDSLEVVQLSGYLKHVDSTKKEGEATGNSGTKILLSGGSIGLIVLFTFIGLFWRRRLRNSVKHSIYNR